MNDTQDCIVLLGDSLTQLAFSPDGFVRRLSEDYVRKLHVINLGLGGYNSEWAIPVFEQYLPKREVQQYLPKMQLLVIWFGANDAIVPQPEYVHSVSASALASNLRRLVNMVKSVESPYYSPWTRVILMTPPPVNTYQRAEDLQSWGLGLDRNFDKTKRYAEVVKDVGIVDAIPVADIWTNLWEASGKDEHTLSKFLTDGLHLNADGYTIVYNELMNVITDKYPEILPDSLNTVFPIWNQLGISIDPLALLQKRDVFAA
ncbi:SGNH hydrolase [Neolentinus lepideus HHB14362 ss-1]|uniref:SGNH hydrolase n=1 Tax=Neolentinus lepideus HHB14362 ss-1 TaxID=1314782 RepID=A0A165TCK6_9AGAM|nr:SGNH hydrolase [Neolentinus lepideus HHB14362 ss-1]